MLKVAVVNPDELCQVIAKHRHHCLGHVNGVLVERLSLVAEEDDHGEDFVIAGAGESQDVAVDQVGRIVSQHGRQLAAACQV